MGTRVDITIISDNPTQAAFVTADIEHAMQKWSTGWYPWGSSPGELKKLNAALASGQSMRVSDELRDLLQQSQQLFSASDGYFDPAIAPMVKVWGFDSINRTITSLPDIALLREWAKNHHSIKDVIINGNEIHTAYPDIQLDLGAIAKGYALDLSMKRMQNQHIASALINIGGQVCVMGTPDKQIRTIQIRDSRINASLASLMLENGESVSTSGDYERYFVIDGQRVNHILDPHTGQPVKDTQMATVIAKSATLADAASTAIMAAGRNWQQIAKQLGVSQVLRIDNTGEIQVTAAMYARLVWNQPVLKSHQMVPVN